MNRIVQDLRYGLRQMRRETGFALTVVLTLALSVGLATAVFCVIDAVILRPLPYAHQERIVAIETRSQSGYAQPASWPSYEDERAQVRAFAALAAYIDFFQATMETPSSGPVLLDTVHSTSDVHLAGQPPNPPTEIRLSEVRFVSTGYFDVFGIPLRRGRLLSPALDHPQGTPTVVVNEAFVKKFAPAGLDPTTQQIDSDPNPKNWTHIVGVVGNVRQNIYERPMPEHDYLLDSMDVKDRADMLNGATLVVRFDGDSAAIVPALRNALHEVDPTVPFKEAKTMTEVISETLIFERMESWLFGIFAGLALLLALVGLYGLLSHEVEQGTRDIGVRMALGASRSRIVGMVLARVSSMLGAGAVAGLLLTVFVRKMIDMVIYFDAEKEAGNVFLIALLLIGAGLMAALLPARRAASVEPMQALRTE